MSIRVWDLWGFTRAWRQQRVAGGWLLATDSHLGWEDFPWSVYCFSSAVGTQPEGVRAEGTEYRPLLSDPVKGLALLLLLSPLPATSFFFLFFLVLSYFRSRKILWPFPDLFFFQTYCFCQDFTFWNSKGKNFPLLFCSIIPSPTQCAKKDCMGRGSQVTRITEKGKHFG